MRLVPGATEEDLFLRRFLLELPAAWPDASCVVFTDPVNHDRFEPYDRVCVEEDRSWLPWSVSPLARAIADAKIDRLLTPLALAPRRCPVPMVSLVMQVHTLRDPGLASQFWGGVRAGQLEQNARCSARVLVPSEFARRSLLEWIRVPYERCTITGVGADHLSSGPQPRSVEEPYFLAVCPTRGDLGVDLLLRTFRNLSEQISHLLVVAGEPGDAEPADWGDRVIRFHQLPAASLVGLYQHAEAALCLASHDSSAMAVLEALGAGARVVAGKVGAVQELARNAPMYCDPARPGSLAGALQFAAGESEDQRRHRVQAGTQAAREHTWRRCAERVILALNR
jgi:glycosyltransferase involved in cell wall biosynthesis